MQTFTHKSYSITRDDNAEIVTKKPTLWHCNGSRSFRALWLLEELQTDYDLVILNFPPRYEEENYLHVNGLGTVPYFVNGSDRMTESTGICHYIASTFIGGERLLIDPSSDHYADFLNWLYMSDATLTFPQTVMLRYSVLEPEEGRLPQVVEHYKEWFLARLTKLGDHLEKTGNQYLCGNQFSIADIAVGYSILLGSHEWLKLSGHYSPAVTHYLEGLKKRPAFLRAINPLA